MGDAMIEDTKAQRRQQEAAWLVEMERLGPEIVRSRLANRMPVTDAGPHPEAEFVRDWLDKKARSELAQQHATIRATLRWARIAGWAGIVGAVAAIVGIVVTIWLAKHEIFYPLD